MPGGGAGQGVASTSNGSFGAGSSACSRSIAEDKPPTFWHQFTQQRLRAWHPIFSPRCVIPVYLVFGTLSICLGIILLWTVRQVVEIRSEYTDLNLDENQVGELTIHVTRDMEPPIWVFYQLDGFFQNHRRFVKSYAPRQLNTDYPPLTERPLQDCAPAMAIAESAPPGTQCRGGRVHYPCGLVARSVFNDSYVFLRQNAEDGEWSQLSVNSEAKTIAWPADTTGRKFKNANPEATVNVGGTDQQHQVAMNMWILETFPRVKCQQVNFSNDRKYVPISVARRNETWTSGAGCGATVQVADCKNYAGDAPTCNFATQSGEPFACTEEQGYKKVVQSSWGIESGHLIVWMRIAGQPDFRKLWGRVDEPLKANTTLKVFVHSTFPVQDFGRKSLVLSTGSILGGRNDFLGYGYIIIGGCCVIFGIWKLVQCMCCPRPLGDVSLLSAQR